MWTSLRNKVYLKKSLKYCFIVIIIKADWIAKRLVKEYLRKARGERQYEPLEIQMEELDEAVAYTTLVHFPNVILRSENKVICARFYTSSEKSVTFELEEWAEFLAESILK